ncbi:DNA-directed RNA polymerase subunit delta [Salimicrobium halophilum]|uniref:Probable DNA-directed RNA polymerase subunit delta n=1 Tax=Salimicrobium halophilum TaxID=86666 RepID=A0A1G8WAW4_9BACI|nr:DNA-directed RNA polymerase subunit delta [Salimicrobium halophilum]SDJ75326.1 DNA-directed RNA polymerase subunit delta [Salimicrobium halophilum]
MSLKDLTQQQIDETSMLEMAYVVLEDQHQTYDFNDLFHQIADMKGFSEARKEDAIAQFYTDMNLDGRFTTTGTNQWGLRKWYPIEQMEEDIANLPKVRKKKKKKKKPSKLLEDELGVSEYDSDDDEDGMEDLDLTDEDLDLDDDDDFEGDYEEDDLDEEEEEMVSEDTSFIGDEDEDDDDQ